jgi:hypothetical protein
MTEFAENPGLFPASYVERRNAIIVESGNGTPIELQTVEAVPETYSITIADSEVAIPGERLILRTGETLIPAAYTQDEDDSLVILATSYESIPDSMEGPLLRTRKRGDEIRFQELVGSFEDKGKQIPEEQIAVFEHGSLFRLGVRNSFHGYWLRLNAGLDSEPHARGKILVARIAFLLRDVNLDGIVPIINDESGNEIMYDPPKQFEVPNPWLYVIASDGDPDDA